MLKKNLLLLFLIAVSPWCGMAENLLENGDFSQKITHWKFWDYTRLAIEKNSSPSGKNVLKVWTEKEHYGSNKSVTAQKLKPDTFYRVTGWMKTVGQAQFYLHVNTGKVQKNSRVIYQTAPWTPIDIVIKSGAAAKSGQGAESGMNVATRIIGRGTAYFADLEVKEISQKSKNENLFINSDFRQKTVYRDLPDGWIPGMGTGTANPENHTFKVQDDVIPPVKGAQVVLAKNVAVIGHTFQSAIPGNVYTLSFYAKNAVKGKNTRLRITFASKRNSVTLTDNWKRYSFTGTVNRKEFLHYMRSPDYDSQFYFSAPVLNIGNTPIPWKVPEKRNIDTIAHSNENIGVAVSTPITGIPNAEDWAKAPAYPINQVSAGNPGAVLPSTAKILHNNKFLFICFDGKKALSGKPDSFELFLCNSVNDGTYIHHVFESSGETFSARNTVRENLDITTQVTQNKDTISAVVSVPLSLLNSGRIKRINFSRTYTHPRYGQTAVDWAQPFSRHVPVKFGLLRGLPQEKQEFFGIIRFYSSQDKKKLFCVFNSLPEKSKEHSVNVALLTNGKKHWSKNLVLKSPELVIDLPGNLDSFARSETEISLEIKDKTGKTAYRFSRVLHLLFSSFAKFDGGMEVYPKYNIFTEKDKNIELFVNMDKKRFDYLQIKLLNHTGKAIHSFNTTENIQIPLKTLPEGEYKISVDAVKNAKNVSSRCHETFRILPWRAEMVRLNRLKRCLMTENGAVIPLMYHPGGSPEFALDPGVVMNRSDMLSGARDAGFNGIKRAITPPFNPGQLKRWLNQAEKLGLVYFFDPSSLFPRSYYTAGQTREEGLKNEKMTLEWLRKIQNICSGHKSILSYLVYHEPNYFRGSEGIVDQNRMADLLPVLRAGDLWRPVSGIWTPKHVDDNGEPFGSIDAVDYFFVDVYTRNLRIHCDELFRLGYASKITRRPIGQIFKVSNLGSMMQSCPTPAEYRAQVCTALIAGYRVFYLFLGVPPAKETWQEMKLCNFKLREITGFICHDNCIEKASENDRDICFAVYRLDNKVMLIYSSKLNDKNTSANIEIEKISGLKLSGGKSLFNGKKVILQNGCFQKELAPAESDILIFE